MKRARFFSIAKSCSIFFGFRTLNSNLLKVFIIVPRARAKETKPITNFNFQFQLPMHRDTAHKHASQIGLRFYDCMQSFAAIGRRLTNCVTFRQFFTFLSVQMFFSLSFSLSFVCIFIVGLYYFFRSVCRCLFFPSTVTCKQIEPKSKQIDFVDDLNFQFDFFLK